MPLFKGGDFVLHSGERSDFLIDCEALSEYDLIALAALAARRLRPFGRVEGIPRGGLRFAEALRTFARKESAVLLIADDVTTTGRSLEEARARLAATERYLAGVVIFSRGYTSPWVLPLFLMTGS